MYKVSRVAKCHLLVGRPGRGGGGTSRSFGESVWHGYRPRPYFRPKYVILRYSPKIQTYSFSGLVSTIHTRFQTFRPKCLKCKPYFRPKRVINHTFWRHTYLRYRGVPPGYGCIRFSCIVDGHPYDICQIQGAFLIGTYARREHQRKHHLKM